MTPIVTRRQFLFAATACAAVVSGIANAQGVDDGLIFRQEIEGVDPRYARYATVGPYLVPATPITMHSGDTKIVLFHPLAIKSARLIVFSHGALADPLTYREMIWHWVSHGFVVAAPLHADAIIEHGPTLRKNKAGAVSQWPISALLEDSRAWKERADACCKCLDEIARIEVATGVKIIADRPVIAGHGYGAYVAQLLLGSTVSDSDGNVLSFTDSRFFAGIVMSPQGPGIMGLHENSWVNLAEPMLYMVAEDELDFTGQPSGQKAKSYLLAKPGYKHMGMLKKGSSNIFSGQVAQTNSLEAKLFEVTLAMTTCFLLAYSNYDSVAFQDMTTNFFERMSLGAVDEGKR